MNDALLERIRQSPTLPSLPAIAMQVLELTQKEEVDIAEIARIISKDPALSSKILRTVNSSFYGRSQSVSTISHALVILGLQSVKTLVLGFSLVSSLSKSKGKGFKHLTYWRRSIFGATAARAIAKKLEVVQQEECFLAALLMDIGMLVLDQALGEEYGHILEPLASHNELADVETAALGMSHAEVAAFLAGQWNLPPLLSVPMKHHHSPRAVADPSLAKLSEVICLAGRCADVFTDEHPGAAIAAVRTAFQEGHKMSSADCDAMLDEIGRRTKEIAPLFEISIGASSSFEAILKKANETLVDLTLRSQQHATALAEQNQQLRVAATTDGLTGLANRAQFDTRIAELFDWHLKNEKPMALLMLDLDKFKSVNDTHGHQVGDAVLKYVGKLLRTAARANDVAARYGGEEMAVILPGTTRATAAAIAETICRATAAKPVSCGPTSLLVTLSIGVAAFEPGGLFCLPAHLIKAADMAVYAAKHAGRNCVRVITPKPAAKAA